MLQKSPPHEEQSTERWDSVSCKAMSPGRDPRLAPKRGGVGALSVPPQQSPGSVCWSPPSSRPQVPGERIEEGLWHASPLPQAGGGGEEEGADGSNYGSDPPPPIARGRKISFARFRGREGRLPPRPGAGGRGAGWGAQVREGTSFPREWGWESPLGKAKPSLPASRSPPQSSLAGVPTVPRFRVSALRGFSGPGW